MAGAGNTIKCKQCGEEIEVSAALQGQIEEQVLAAAHKRHEAEMQKVLADAAEAAKREREQERALTQKLLDGERTRLAREKAAEIELEKKRLESESLTVQRKAAAEQELLIKRLREDAEEARAGKQQLEKQFTELMQSLRAERKARESAELEAEKKIAAEESKIREEASKAADERQRLNIAAKEKTITDLQKALAEAQRKAAQGSQQLQGEVLELDLEKSLTESFRDDAITPVAKGVNGADISQTVRSPRGTDCGVILWEIKRTKNWTDGWIPKLKSDLRASKSNIAVIVTQVMPKQISGDMGQLEGIWICKPALSLVLAALLRKPLLDVGAQKALAQNRGGKAEALYNYITSHEFIQQIESMVETYQEMTLQVQKERVAYEKMWSQREKQAHKLFLGTANIVGGMQGHIGQASMPRIKGLELDGDEPVEEDVLAGLIGEPQADDDSSAEQLRVL